MVTFDANKRQLEGSCKYKLHLPPNIPASNFWSIIVYDSHSQFIIKSNQPWPSVHSHSSQLTYNQDGSVDIWFGPEPPVGSHHNWIQTLSGKSWNLILRLYYPTESWFDESWRPGEIEEVVLQNIV